jgi:excisionase family DNA binding protein
MPTNIALSQDATVSRRLLRVNNVCRRLELPERTVRWLAKHGRIRARKIDGKSWGFLSEDVERYRLENRYGQR